MYRVTTSQPEFKYSWYGENDPVLEKRILFYTQLIDQQDGNHAYSSPYLKSDFKCILVSKERYRNGVPEDNIFGYILLDDAVYDCIQLVCGENNRICSTYPIDGNVAPLLIPSKVIFNEIAGKKIETSDINIHKETIMKLSGLFQFKLYFMKCIEDNTDKCCEPAHSKLWELHCKMVNGLLTIDK